MSQLSLNVADGRPARSGMTAIAFPMLLVVVALVSLPLGGNRPWAWELLGAFIGLLVVLLGLEQLFRPNEHHPSLSALKVPALLFAVVIGWAMVQCVPFTPQAWKHPLWSQAQDYLGQNILTSVSINRVASVSRIFRLL